MKKKELKKSFMLAAMALGMSVIISGCGGREEPGEASIPDAVSTPEENQESQAAGETSDTSHTPDTADLTLTDGYFTYTINNEGAEYLNYIHFYENGVFYYSKYNNGQYQAGYYELDENPCEIISTGAISGEGEETSVACESKIIFYDMDGTTVLGEAGYHKGGNVIGVTLQDHRDFVQDVVSGHSSEDETGVNMAEFYVENDEYSLVAIKHNGTFQDTIGSLISGTWTRDGDVYSLTDEAAGAVYTMTDNGDGSAAYVGEDGTEMTLYGIQQAAVAITLSGTVEASYGELAAEFSGFDDGTASMTIQYAGTENVMNGTWEMASDYSKLTIVLDDTEYEAPMDFTTQTFSMEFTASDGVKDVTVLLEQAAQ